MNPDSSPHPGSPGSAGSDSAAGHPARLAVGIVGAGRAGTALGVALARAGHQVVAASAVSDASLRRAHANFPDALITDPGQVLRRADLALLTVPDDVLPGLIAGLAATGAPLAGRLLAHASGRYGVTVLEEAVRQGALPLALHPVMTFTGRSDDVDRLRGTSFGVTAPEVLRPAAEALVIEMGGEPVFIAEEDRDLYHAALASKPAPVQDGFSGDQQFFIAFGQNFGSKEREAALRQQVMTDPHSPGEYRADMVRNVDAWYPAFNVQPGEKLYLAPPDRVQI